MNDPETFFGGAPEAFASAPGRVNLLGEHTDYNDGFMLPVATPQRTEVALARSHDDRHHLYSGTLDGNVSFAAQGGSAPQGFGSYVEGCIRLLEAEGIAVPPLRMFVTTALPVGSGLSSSAALEVAVLRALRDWLGVDLDDVRLAQIAQRAEIEYARVNCGIMDQMASSLCDERNMLFIDARTLEHRLVALPADTELIVIDSGVPRTLAASKYNERRAECEEAARKLGVKALRDVADAAALEALPDTLRRRARHVVLEDLRVLEAARGVSAERFGELMDASHDSLRDDYEVSIPELDLLVAALRAAPGVLGARLTGAGFGGACVALCRAGQAEQAAHAALSNYNKGGRQGSMLIPVPTQGKEHNEPV
ncbi:galactokinase [Massilia forsythiae]|uniref:Galactokinase n=1 Tax=Massilia forsythiae TaxID=2728020 RepID=A0A7Z2VTS0_9BURK|nr:galactokinase [Massilia forsythiae]QJD98934.1 galactokinase [Massilia forsythiae]